MRMADIVIASHVYCTNACLPYKHFLRGRVSRRPVKHFTTKVSKMEVIDYNYLESLYSEY